jgi:hypothetical protein
MKVVYHCSQIQGLDEIKPHPSSHAKNWVYATKDLVMAAAFLGTTGGDLTCSVGRDEETGKVFICERFTGAFDVRYAGVSGAIYILPGKEFVAGQTQWDEEVVSSQSIKPVREIPVPDAKAFLLQMAKAEKVIIKYYPDKIAYIPEDDEDLVYRAVIWYQNIGDEVLKRFKKYQPGLLPRVKKAIAEKRY